MGGGREKEFMNHGAGNGESGAGIQGQAAIVVGTHVYYAQGRCIRVKALGEEGNAEVVRLDFTVRRLVLNEPADRLAVVGGEALAVLDLEEAVPAAEVIATGPVADVCWHPLSSKASNLLLLTRDAFLRSYELDRGTEADYELDLYALQGIPRAQNSFSPDADEFLPVRMAFGPTEGEPSWSLFTLYLLLRNSDLYALCPLLPLHPLPLQAPLQRLAGLVAHKGNRAAKAALAGSSRAAARRNVYRAQTRWISSLLGQMSFVANFGESEWSRPRQERLCLQGPYLLQPPPSESANACDLLCLQVSNLTLLALAHTDGRVDLAVEVDPVEALWQSGASVPPLTLSVYESIDLLCPDDQVKLAEDPAQTGSLFVACTSAIYRITTSADLLAQTGPKGAVIQRLDVGGPISDFVVLVEPSLGYSLLTLQPAGSELKELSPWSEQTPQASPSPSLEQITDDRPTYQGLLSRPIYTPSALHFHRYANDIPPGLRGMLGTNEEALRFCGKIVERVRHDTEMLQRASSALHTRTSLQTREMARQVQKLGEIREKLDAREGMKERIERAATLQGTLHASADRMLQQLLRYLCSHGRNRALSDQEKRFFAEIDRLESKIHAKQTFSNVRGGLQLRGTEAAAQVDMLQQAVASMGQQRSEGSMRGITTSSTRSLREELHKALQQAKLVEACKTRLQRCDAQLSGVHI